MKCQPDRSVGPAGGILRAAPRRGRISPPPDRPGRTGRRSTKDRQERREHHVAVGRFDELGHEEDRGADDRRHQLTAGRGDRLDPARHRCREAGAFHQRDGDDAGADDVGDRAAGDRAEQHRAEHRDLAGAAAKAADRGGREVGEERAAAGDREQLAEQDEDQDHLHGDPQRGAEDRVGVDAEVDHQAAEVDRPARDLGRQQVADHGEPHEAHRHQRKRGSGGAAHALDREHDERGREHDALGRPLDQGDDQDRIAEREIGPGREADQRQQGIERPKAAVAHAAPVVVQEQQAKRETETRGHVLLGVQRQAEPARRAQQPEQRDDHERGRERRLDPGGELVQARHRATPAVERGRGSPITLPSHGSNAWNLEGPASSNLERPAPEDSAM